MDRAANDKENGFRDLLGLIAASVALPLEAAFNFGHSSRLGGLLPQLFRHVRSVKYLSGLANHYLCHTEKLGQLFENDIGGAQ
jgi:hypothetical protein